MTAFEMSAEGEVSELKAIPIAGSHTVKMVNLEMTTLLDVIAKRPRVEADCLKILRNDCLQSVQSAEQCNFALPRRERRGHGDDDVKMITGPTARFAESVVRSWGRCRIAGEITEIDDRWVVAEGRFLDFESMLMLSQQVRRPIRYANGGTFRDDMIAVTANAAVSIAKRNVSLAGIPSAYWRPVYDECCDLVRRNVGANLQKSIEDAFKAFEEQYRINSATLMNYLGVRDRSEIKVHDVVDLRGLFTTLKAAEEGERPKILFDAFDGFIVDGDGGKRAARGNHTSQSAPPKKPQPKKEADLPPEPEEKIPTGVKTEEKPVEQAETVKPEETVAPVKSETVQEEKAEPAVIEPDAAPFNEADSIYEKLRAMAAGEQKALVIVQNLMAKQITVEDAHSMLIGEEDKAMAWVRQCLSVVVEGGNVDALPTMGRSLTSLVGSGAMSRENDKGFRSLIPFLRNL